MRVLIICDTMRIGGKERLTISMANEFLRLKNECSILVIWNRRLESLAYLKKQIPVFLGRRSHKFDFSYLEMIRRELKHFRPDVILCEANFAYLSLKLAGAARYSPIFLVIHYTHNYAKRDEFFDRVLFRLLKLSADKIIAVYRKQIEHFSNRYNINKERFVVIHNGVDTQYFINDVCKSRQLARGNALFNIAHIANYRVEKDQWTLLEALPKLDREFKNWKLTFCGSVPEKVKDRFVHFVKENKIYDKVVFLDYVEDVREVLQCADSFVLSSISEALPMSALEAMAMGVPCVLTDVGGCSEIIDDGVNGFLVPVKKPNAIAEKLLYLCQHSYEKGKMGEEARQTVINRFNIKRMAEEYLRLFEREIN